MVYFISRIIFKLILKAFFGFEVIGIGNIPEKGPFIMAANHLSYADPVVMGVACNTVPIVFIAKKELFSLPFTGSWFKAVGCIPVDRSSKSSVSLRMTLERLKRGAAIGIFPEGRRSVNGALQEAEPGVGLLVAKSRVPVIPVYIVGTNKALPIGRRMPVPSRVKAYIGEPVRFTGFNGSAAKRDKYESISAEIMAAIGRLKDNEGRWLKEK